MSPRFCFIDSITLSVVFTQRIKKIVASVVFSFLSLLVLVYSFCDLKKKKMAAILSLSVLRKLADYTISPVLRQFGYLYHYEDNVKHLTSQVEMLNAKRTDVKLLVQAATDNLEVIASEVNTWSDPTLTHQRLSITVGLVRHGKAGIGIIAIAVGIQTRTVIVSGS